MSRFGNDAPRPHHYEFAHRALPAVAARFAADVAAWRTGDLDGLLRHLWAEAGERLPEPDRLDPDGLRGEVVEVAGHDAILVTLPPATSTAEAHFVALVAAAPPRVVTLEYTLNVDDSVATVLGEWHGGGHVNRGEGPPPDRDAFLAVVAGLLDAEPPSGGRGGRGLLRGLGLRRR